MCRSTIDAENKKVEGCGSFRSGWCGNSTLTDLPASFCFSPLTQNSGRVHGGQPKLPGPAIFILGPASDQEGGSITHEQSTPEPAERNPATRNCGAERP